MEKKQIIYDFCPKCGALMKNGICMSCSYGAQGAVGNDGVAGAQDAAGIDGTAGAQDTAGINGAAGAQKKPGPEGAAAETGFPAAQDSAAGQAGAGADAGGAAVPGDSAAQAGQEMPAGQGTDGSQGMSRPGDPEMSQQGAQGMSQPGSQPPMYQMPYSENAGQGAGGSYGPSGSYGGNGGYGAHQPARPQKHTGLIVGLCVGAAVFLGLLCLALSMIVSGARASADENPLLGLFEGADSRDIDDAWDEDLWEEGSIEESASSCYDGKHSSYVPSPEDEFCEEIVDSLREDLSYQVIWKEFSVENKAEEISAEGVYPQLEGNLPHLQDLNASIEEEVLYYKNVLEEYGQQPDHESCSTESVCYVTYMDEDVISIVLQERITLGGYTLPELHDINIDLRTGTILEHQDMLEYSLDLAEKFRSQNKLQNPDSAHLSELEGEEIQQLLSSYNGVVFYTPVGLEVGFNYDLEDYGIYGWVTVTLKDYQAYRKKI